MAAKPDLSIIIVNWKVRRLLEKCLDSILKYKGNLNLEIFVIDNDSRDNTAEMMMVQYPDLDCISLPRNIGFARANNLGIERAKADVIFLLNPDTEISAGYMQKALEYMRSHPQVGIMGTKILNADKSVQKSIRRFPDFSSQLLVLLKLRNVLMDNKYLSHYLADDFDYSKEQQVDQIMGAAMFIRREVLDKIGLLDEKFFIWFEEIDFCERAHQAGFKLVYYPDISLVHYGGSSFGQQTTLRKQMMFNSSLLYYFRKHRSFVQWLILVLVVPVNILLTFLYAAFIKKREF